MADNRPSTVFDFQMYVIVFQCILVLLNCVFYRSFPFSLSADSNLVSLMLMMVLTLTQLTVCSSRYSSDALCGQCKLWLTFTVLLIPLLAMAAHFIKVSILHDIIKVGAATEIDGRLKENRGLSISRAPDF